MPAGNPPHKRHREGRASDDQRVEMVRRAIDGNPHFSLSMEEMNAEGYSYTYLTLERLKEQNPDTEYFLCTGADSLLDFDGSERTCQNMPCCSFTGGGKKPCTKRETISANEFSGEKV